jgi:hypothetical protein
MFVVKPLLSFVLLSHLFHFCHAQTSDVNDSAVYRSAVSNTIRFFFANSKSVCTCLHGKEYIIPPFSFSEGSPYFLTAEAGEGTLVYEHVHYDSVRLLYDELQDELVYVDESHRIMLMNEKVERFSILGHQFVKFEQQQAFNGEAPGGYFELLYEGNSMMLKREEKKMRQANSFSTEAMVRVIDTRSVYYLRKENHFLRIDGKKAFLKLWGNYQKEIVAFIKHNKIKFKQDPDNDYARITAFCDQLSSSK